MSSESAPPRGRGRGGLGKYLRARGRRGAGRPAEFGRRLVLEDEQGDEGEGGDEDDGDEGRKYAKRQIGTNADRYEEPEADPHAEEEPEPEVDLSTFLAKQRIADQTDHLSYNKEVDEDGIDHTLSGFPSVMSSNTRKNKTHTVEWDASMDELKREKDAAEAVWDLKSRFRKKQPHLVASSSKPSRFASQALFKVGNLEDSRHVSKPPDAISNPSGNDAAPESKTNMEEFLDELLA